MTEPETNKLPQDSEGTPGTLAGFRRGALVALGLVLIALGVLGAVLPGLPSTVFLLGASYCFARSSPRLHRWLLQHPRLGPPLLAWHRHRAMSPRAKALALALMWTGVWISSLAMAGKGPMVVVGLALIGTVVVLFGVRTLAPEPVPPAPQTPAPPSSDRQE